MEKQKEKWKLNKRRISFVIYNNMDRLKEIDFKDDGKEIIKIWKNESLEGLKLALTFSSALAFNELMRSIILKVVKTGSSNIMQNAIYTIMITFITGLITFFGGKTKRKMEIK